MEERAKQIYINFLGRKFQMMREGVLEEYEGFGITEEKEDQWRSELIDYWQGILSSTDVDPVVKLSIMNATEALPQILAFAESGDSYSNLIYANCLWDIATTGDQANSEQVIITKSKKMAIRIWSKIEKGEIYLEQERDLRGWPGMSTQEALRTWASENLQKAGLV